MPVVFSWQSIMLRFEILKKISHDVRFAGYTPAEFLRRPVAWQYGKVSITILI